MQTVKSSFDVTPEGRLVSYRGYESNVIVPTGVTEIGQRAFWGARLMTRLTLPASLRVIGAWGFAGCTSLREVASFGGVTDIGAHAFFSCTALAEVWLRPPYRCGGVRRLCDARVSLAPRGTHGHRRYGISRVPQPPSGVGVAKEPYVLRAGGCAVRPLRAACAIPAGAGRVRLHRTAGGSLSCRRRLFRGNHATRGRTPGEPHTDWAGGFLSGETSALTRPAAPRDGDRRGGVRRLRGARARRLALWADNGAAARLFRLCGAHRRRAPARGDENRGGSISRLSIAPLGLGGSSPRRRRECVLRLRLAPLGLGNGAPAGRDKRE